jgi:hypothetical protein
MSWNWSYTKRKQKEMSEKSAAYQKANDPYQYTLHKPQQNSTQWQKEKEKERRMKIIITIMLTLMCSVYTSIIVYFIVYGV